MYTQLPQFAVSTAISRATLFGFIIGAVSGIAILAVICRTVRLDGAPASNGFKSVRLHGECLQGRLQPARNISAYIRECSGVASLLV